MKIRKNAMEHTRDKGNEWDRKEYPARFDADSWAGPNFSCGTGSFGVIF
jgi:hypothetical protein